MRKLIFIFLISFASFAQGNLVTREIFGNKSDFITFDTKLVEGDLFTIRRASDNIEQAFTYSQIIDGTYASFVSATSGYVKEWKSKNKKLTAFSNAYQPFLIENSGNPYLDFSVQGMCLEVPNNLKIGNDFIATIILNDELNPNSQRNNLALVGNSLVKFAFQLGGGGGFGGVVINTSPAASMTSTKEWAIPNTGLFKLITITYIGGVLNLYINNSIATEKTPTYPIGVNSGEFNKIVLGGRGGISGLGKINKYKHFSIRTGFDLGTFNVSSYNLQIMSKYGI